MSRTFSYDVDEQNEKLAKEFGKPYRDTKTKQNMLSVTRQDLFDFKQKYHIYPGWIQKDMSLRIGRGMYIVPGSEKIAEQTATAAVASKPAYVTPEFHADAPPPVFTPEVGMTAGLLSEALKTLAERFAAITSQASLMSYVPTKDKAFVPWGEDFEKFRIIISRKKFAPAFIAGPSGCGKTYPIEQACALEGREFIRVNITTETDEDDLLGGFRLVNGETVFEPGPVIVAMLRGAVLLFDEIDLASAKIMCLQPVLEGKPILLKKIGVTVSPAHGFVVFATANTKGRGNEDGKYVGTGLLNEAFLERFDYTFEANYPPIKEEKKILSKFWDSLGIPHPHNQATTEVFFDTIAKWADIIRKTYAEGGIEDMIATRRLLHIVKAYAIFGDQDTALTLCLNRFDPKVKSAFADLYNKLAPDTAVPDHRGTVKNPF